MNLDSHHKHMDKKQDSVPLVPIKDIVNSKYPIDPLELLGERSFNEPRIINKTEVGTPIQEFFRDQVIFVTGGTGFMGKVLIEKLLRACPHIKHVYLLIRSKKDKNFEQRLEDMFEDRLFKRLKHEVPEYYLKVSGLAGDCNLPGLGLSENSRNTLINEVNIIFHAAATVRFDEHIRVAMNTNVSGTKKILNLARKVTNLKVISYISSAFANCNKLIVNEKFYTPIADYEDIFKLISDYDDQSLQDMTKELIGDFPNTYTFTKSLTEDLIRREAQDLPILVFRPSIVINTYREPVRGWIDNMYGPTSLMLAICSGVIHTYYGDQKIVTDIIPVDLVTNALICSTKETATRRKVNGVIPIYTCSSSLQRPMNWGNFVYLTNKYAIDWPMTRAIWYYSFSPSKYWVPYVIKDFFYHTVTAYLLDIALVISGQKPMLRNIYKKIKKLINIFSFFEDKEWTFVNNNLLKLWHTLDSRDKELFNFDIYQLDWDYFCQTLFLGLRVYLLKDDIHTLPAARKKWNKLRKAHYGFLALVYSLLLYCLWYVLRATGFM